MRAVVRRSVCWVAVLALATAVGCSDSTRPAARRVGSISVSAARTNLSVGDSVRMTATAFDQDDAVMEGQTINWHSANAGIASVRADGMVTARLPGTSFIYGEAGTAIDSLLISVFPIFCSATTTNGTIALGQVRSGVFTAADCELTARLAQGWQLTLSTNAVVEFSMTSTTPNADVVLTDADGNVLLSGFTPGTSLYFLLAMPPGTYIVWVTTARDMALGGFQLALRQFQSDPCPEVGTIAVGETKSDSIQDSDCEFLNDYRADSWRLSLSSPTTVQIDLMSSEFDPVLLLMSATGHWIALDDDGGNAFNSRLILDLPAGDYFVVPTTFFFDERGRYDLSVTATSSGMPRVGSGQPFTLQRSRAGTPGAAPATVPWMTGRK